MGRSLTQTERDLRKQVRKNFTLKSRMVTPGMQLRYQRSVEQFLLFIQTFGYRLHTWDDLDEMVSEWVEHIFHDGRHKSLASDGLAGLQFFLPQALGRLKHSWKLCKVWQKLEPPRRVLPLSPLVLCGFAGAAVRLGFTQEAAGLLIGYDCMLRSGELYRLTVGDVAFYDSRAVLSLGFTKMGQRLNSAEMVVVESQLAVKYLRLACQGRPRRQPLLERGDRFFRSLFTCMVELFDIPGLITVYSLRRGGASWDFLQHQSMERTLLRGRWASTSSARLYLQDATAMVSHLSLSSNSRSLLQAAANTLRMT